jgi:hypothetical protein
MSMVDWCRPRLLVELGTHYGESYCAFCQAVDTLKLSTRCVAIDTWEGDAGTGAYAGVYEDLQAHHDPLYSRFSTLMRCRFDEAVDRFASGSIDLLHIDGGHSYDEVRHDFETWLPKMSNYGVIMFHDTQVRDPGFGVWKLWAEISPRFPSFEFTHTYGLGILGVGEDLPETVRGLFESGSVDPLRIRRFYRALGQRAYLNKLFRQGTISE